MPTSVQEAQAWLTQWNWHPSVFLILLLLIGAYVYSIGPLRRRYQLADAVSRGRMVAFFLGLAALALCVITPLQAIAHILFTGHMIQHMVLALVAAPLLVVGLPGWLVAFCLRPRPLRFVFRWLTMPLIAALLFNANLWLWHAPSIMNSMMMSDAADFLSLTLYLLTGMLFWWPLFGAQVDGIFSLNAAGKLIYILLSDMPMVLLGAGLTFTPPLYPMYEGTARLIGWSPSTDQQLGGLIMWVPGGIYLIVMASVILIQWFRQIEKQQQAENMAFMLEEEEAARNAS
ncbi:cytochrome c oxidase assembly protein [Dictyobacter arantiisoli]|uniref:Membrane protein n=1 Tax=Dictyobacter arantiisoli TaxID=2014874 RepID=A0A5A5THU5_9CHLR|nr:cytochrome c oxidase assembly protein [Dictyobacter arantiisoli]GCF11160.1 membrane protein [Dictyobacter arantiisoli]